MTPFRFGWLALVLPLLVLSLGLPGAPLAKLIGQLFVALARVGASRVAFEGLWGPRYLRPLFWRTLGAVPVPIILWLGDFRPLVAVAVSGGWFLCWVAATAHSSGVLQLLRPAQSGRGAVGGELPPYIPSA